MVYSQLSSKQIEHSDEHIYSHYNKKEISRERKRLQLTYDDGPVQVGTFPSAQSLET